MSDTPIDPTTEARMKRVYTWLGFWVFIMLVGAVMYGQFSCSRNEAFVIIAIAVIGYLWPVQRNNE